MNAKCVTWVILIAVVILGSSATTMAAHVPYFSHYALWPCVYVLPNVYVDQPAPYFAAFPPIYYTHTMRPVSGYEAYVGFSITEGRRPAPAPPPPLRIQNRFVVGDADATPTGERAGPAPLRIVNPFLGPF